MKKLNFKTMAKEMSFKDKATLLFADFNRRCESKGIDRLITPDEETAIVKVCQKKKEIARLNELTRYFNLVHRTLADVRLRTVRLELAMSQIDNVVLGIYFRENAKDLLSKQKGKKKGDDDDSQVIIKGFKDIYSWFHPFECEDEDDFEKYIEFCKTREPNVFLQHKFKDAVLCFKSLKQSLYAVDWFVRKADGVELLSDYDKETLNEADQQIEMFLNLEGFSSVIGMYRDARASMVMRQEGLSVPLFEEFLLNPDEALRLKSEDFEEADEVIQAALQN